VVKLKSGPEGEIQSSAADGFERVGEDGETLAAESLRPENYGGGGDETGENAANGADPVIVDCPFEKESGGNEECHNTYAAEELGAYTVFERRCWLGKVLCEVRRGICVGGEGRCLSRRLPGS
jgi:hypothetical protein